MIIPLSSLVIGMDGIIVRLEFEETIKERFIAMGLIPGKKITYVHESPFGDPMIFKIEDNKIMIRKDEANKIFIEVTEEILSLDESVPGEYEIFIIKSGVFFRRELENMNIKPGNKINVINNHFGKVTMEINGKKIVFGRGRARKILLKK
ncbi:ferrous iron transport protein A [Marinitoga hydrogenitolerans DSM 16785]|uniref:Ferrous iron transport protein A n=1 Tax=Marinitoga hydrogenitolerans (strain DSM 16785 / JCM 12826 / AT1271) TaxID=1122195 RepID=A0A1M4SMM8_MARH1|nr:FeoA family protein [Marinitoga hydrogenitolerans]SHE33428.1 ferrous iron transport protein A [Marinitoga hydrogenitolerans DSM 16785]